MNREIKFRGKRIANGEWAYGSLLIWADGECTILENSDSSNAVWKREIDPATVGQFTGLCDRYGREIYEGDVINWLSFTYGGRGFMEEGRVEWRQSEGCYVVVNRLETKDGRESIHLLIRCTRDIRVVGNIHDNPELLKVGNQ